MIETEIKFKIADAVPIRRKLRSMGARFNGKFFQSNILLDTPDGRLRKSGCLLRIRSEKGRALVTFKGKAMKSRFKKRPEANIAVENAAKIEKIFNLLGFEKNWAYEKETEYFRLKKAAITIDKMPAIGYVMEIEASPGEIKKTAKGLGLGLKEGMKDTYADIFRQLKKQGKLKGKNWVFR